MRLNSCADADDAAEQRAAARGQRVEQPHLDVGDRGEAAEQLVLAAGVEVVDEQADAHAAPGGIAQLAQELQADAVVGQVVVLDVERALGPSRQRQPGVEGEVAGRQQPKARFAGAGLLQAGGGQLAERGAGGVGHRRARGPLGQRRQAGAAGERCAQQEHDEWQEAGKAGSAHAMSPPVRGAACAESRRPSRGAELTLGAVGGQGAPSVAAQNSIRPRPQRLAR